MAAVGTFSKRERKEMHEGKKNPCFKICLALNAPTLFPEVQSDTDCYINNESSYKPALLSLP
jgi:hypothetical protein